MKTIKMVLFVFWAGMLLAACGKEPKAEQEKQLPQSGYKAYRYTVDSDGNIVKDYMVMEYEDIGTERTHICFRSAEETDFLNKWYYDSTGERLVKEVSWERECSTIAKEYDSLGRVVRCSLKLEENNDRDRQFYGLHDHWIDFCMPEEYFEINPKLISRDRTEAVLWDFDFSSVNELTTEYTYDGDTDKIKTIKSVTNTGAVVGSLELGDGDIVISRRLIGSETACEEQYDPDSREARWTYRDEDGLSEEGVISYDEQGRCTFFEVRHRLSGITSSMTFTYFEDHYERCSETKRNSNLECTERVAYDYSNAILSREYYGIDDETTKLYKSIYDEYEYYENGILAKYTGIWYNVDGSETMREVNEYDRSGAIVKEARTYGYGEKIENIKTYEYLTEPGIGKIRREVISNTRGESKESETETLSVSIPDVAQPGSEVWQSYSVIYLEAGEEPKQTEHVEYYSDGHIKRIEELVSWDPKDFSEATPDDIINFYEFDERGRLVKSGDIDHGVESGTLYEYWEKTEDGESGK